MVSSQNGWSAYESSTGLVSFPWVTGRVRPGDVYTVLNYLARRFNAEVEGIEAWQSWGWNYRAVRGAAALSNHASGTAVDFNATRHALGARGTFNARQVAAIRRILADLGGVVRWGGDYTGRADEMHFEINATPARVAVVARAISVSTVSNPITPGGAGVAKPTISGVPAPLIPEGDDMLLIRDNKTGAVMLVAGGIGAPVLGGDYAAFQKAGIPVAGVSSEQYGIATARFLNR